MNEEQELPGDSDFFSTEEVYQIAALVNEKLAGVEVRATPKEAGD